MLSNNKTSYICTSVRWFFDFVSNIGSGSFKPL
jgi:hypothetical protein